MGISINWIPVSPPQYPPPIVERTKVRNDLIDALRKAPIATPNSTVGIFESSICVIKAPQLNAIEIYDTIIEGRCSVLLNSTSYPVGWAELNSSPAQTDETRSHIAQKILGRLLAPGESLLRMKLRRILNRAIISYIHMSQSTEIIHSYDCHIIRKASLRLSDVESDLHPYVATVTMPNRQTGYVCLGTCNGFFASVKPNRPNGYICRECRS